MQAGSGSTILVTGASGFAGAQLARTLAARRHHVRALARSVPRVQDLRTAGIELCEGDLTNRASLERACDGVRLVYNLAALTGRGAGLPECRAVNATGVGTLIEAAGAAGVRRVVHCSSAEVHGALDRLPANEDSALRPRSSVDATRLEGEQVAGDAAARTGVELVVARLSGLYGPGDCRWLPLFRGVARRRFVVLGTGEVTVHLTYIDDAVEGLRLGGESSRAVGRTYLLAGGEAMKLCDLVRLIAREAGVDTWPFRLPVWPVSLAAAAGERLCAPFGIRPPLGRGDLDMFTTPRAFDISRARAELGYAPRVDVREGVRRCLEWYRGQNLL